METRTRNDAGACCMAEGSAPCVKGYSSILALFCCHLATREFGNMAPAAAGPLRRKQLLLFVLPGLSSLGKLRAGHSGCSSHWSAHLWEGTISFINRLWQLVLRSFRRRGPEANFGLQESFW